MLSFTECLGLTLLVIVIFLAIYTIVDRICNCKERCAAAKAFGAVSTIGKDIDMKKIFQGGKKDE